jgi:hypothetical protein
MKLIIDATSGTVLDAEDCYVVDTEKLSDIERDELESGSDSEIANIAQVNGIAIKKMGADTGWGDNAYRYTVSYSPLSIKDEADALLEGGIYESPEDEKYKRVLEWARSEAAEDQLQSISDFIMGHDGVWDGFRENLMEALIFIYDVLHP